MRKGRPRYRAATSDLATVRLLVDDIAAGIRVLQSRDGVPVSNDQILERARNIVTALIGNYRISSVDAKAARGEGDAEIAQLDLLDRLNDSFEERFGASRRERDRLEERFDDEFSLADKTARA